MINDDMTVPSWDVEGGRVVQAALMLKCLKITDGDGNTILTAGAGNAHLANSVNNAVQNDQALKVEECYVPVSPNLLAKKTIH